MIDPVIAGPINQLRAKYGLSAVAAILRDWWHSPRMVIGMFPAWFAAPQPDWPSQLRLTSFPLYDERGISHLPEHLESFLESGDPPVAFTPGSAMFDGAHFFSVAADVCRRLGVRGLLLSRHREHLPSNLPRGLIHAEYAPFSQLLPRVAALVHHGGIGTTAQGMAAGARQLVVPMSHDQFDNAHRVRMLGVAEVVKSSWLTPWRAARALRRLLDSRGVAANCRSIAERFVGVDGLEMSCDLVESLAQTTTASPGTVQAHSLPSH
jgi:UDP:flavonoid glycosyltransferase YjiC (YdhE family)